MGKVMLCLGRHIHQSFFVISIIWIEKTSQIPCAAFNVRPSCDIRRSRYRGHGRQLAAGARFFRLFLVALQEIGLTPAVQQHDGEKEIGFSRNKNLTLIHNRMDI
jgi:hypothetical protein